MWDATPVGRKVQTACLYRIQVAALLDMTEGAAQLEANVCGLM